MRCRRGGVGEGEGSKREKGRGQGYNGVEGNWRENGKSQHIKPSQTKA